MHPIMKLKEDIDRRIQEECEEIKKADNPMKEVEVYAKNIRWYSLELAAYVRKQMIFTMNLGGVMNRELYFAKEVDKMQEPKRNVHKVTVKLSGYKKARKRIQTLRKEMKQLNRVLEKTVELHKKLF